MLDRATLWPGDGGAIDGHVVVEDGLITAVERGRYHGALPVTDLTGMALSPGLIDLMVLGGFGHSIQRDDAGAIAREYLRLGVTTIQFCTGGLVDYDRIVANIERAMSYPGVDAARIAGLYLEGPFMQPHLTGGAMKESAQPPDDANLDRVLNWGDVITMVNISPGTTGDAAAIHRLFRAGKVVSMAHSDAPADRVLECVDAGTTVLGHCWDNNSGLRGDSGVQQPTIEQVAFTDDRVRYIHLISDGTHVHPVMIRLVLRARGVEALVLVTDAVAVSGCPDGPFTWDDGRTFVKKDGVSRIQSNNNLAGSATLLPDDFRLFVKFTGLPPHVAIRTVTFNPAANIHMNDRIGIIAPGHEADMVAWDDRLRVKRVWRGGQEVANISDFAEVAA